MRHRFTAQMLVRLRAEADLIELLLADGSVLARFDRKKLMSMQEDVIAWSDEVHEDFLGITENDGQV